MDAHAQAKTEYITAKNELIRAVMVNDSGAVKDAYIARKRAMAARITLVHQEKALAKQAEAKK